MTRDSIQRHCDTETDEVAPVAGVECVAIRGTQGPRSVVPRAATEYPVTAGLPSCPRTPVSRCSGVAAVPAVLHPLVHVSVHVVQPERVRRERAHRHGPFSISSLASRARSPNCNVHITASSLPGGSRRDRSPSLLAPVPPTVCLPASKCNVAGIRLRARWSRIRRRTPHGWRVDGPCASKDSTHRGAVSRHSHRLGGPPSFTSRRHAIVFGSGRWPAYDACLTTHRPAPASRAAACAIDSFGHDSFGRLA